MSTSNEKTKYTVEMTGRDRIEVDVDSSGTPKVRFRGCTQMMDLMQSMRRNFGIDPSKWPMPSGSSHTEMLLRELILKMNGQWTTAYKHVEVCHCRNVSTHTVDQAILAGAHTPQVVSRHTSASTACGTCRPDVQKMIDHRLQAGLPPIEISVDSEKPSKKTA